MTVSTDGVAIGLLRSMLACRSVTPEADGVMDLLASTLIGLGFSVERLAFSGGGSYPVDNLFASIGSGAPHLLFAGHTDVVPPGDPAAWSHDPFGAVETEGRLFGRGAVDMKSGIAAFVGAVARAHAEGRLRGTISLMITNDEEADAVNGTKRLVEWAVDKGLAFDFALVGEPSSVARLGDAIKIGRRGSLSGRVTVTGIQGHVAYPERARNPLPVLAAIATALTKDPLDTGTERFQPSNLEIVSIDTGNRVTNVIPESGTLVFNVRHNDLWTAETLTGWIEERIGSVDAQSCTIRHERIGNVSRCFHSPESGAVALLSDVIAAHTGSRPALSTGGGTSDARFIAPICPVVECGLVGTTMHKVDENVPIAEVLTLEAIYADFIAAFGATAS
ncbi:succinyl-diaminopimelate desuccinylase [Arsenicitalea aurantiaca]|uniref:Succinyl-diaminopimelate desuccinylase n=1 Tax=Arsenicitalea aurantiaca TaxID=1783274 RepID=A0A433X2F4_9HYPH|nr:succinyl-diaminopimelate desuccinylase [Arsenicitalea aurantiaca]RUT28217.1 succinyl-diaminopimelate desuccinylase [Arsenicitalea aurantiaca]